jgi:hypothetical protein
VLTSDYTTSIGSFFDDADNNKAHLTIGNDVASTAGTNGRTGILRIYSDNANYSTVRARGSLSTSIANFYLPDTSTAYAVWTAEKDNAVGDTNLPIYLSGKGKVEKCSIKLGCDKNNKDIVDTYETKNNVTTGLATTLQSAKNYTDSVKTALLGDTLTFTFDTLKEIHDWIEGDGVNATELSSEIAKISAKTLTASNGISTGGTLGTGITITGVDAATDTPGIITIEDQSFKGKKTFISGIGLKSTLTLEDQTYGYSGGSLYTTVSSSTTSQPSYLILGNSTKNGS